MNEFIETTININKLNIIVGDINFDFSKQNPRILAMNRMFETCGLTIISNFFTRVTNESKTQIDLVLTNKPDLLACQIENSERISDHETISICFKNDLKITEVHETFLSWKNYSIENLIGNLRNCNRYSFEIMNVNEKIELIRSNLETSVKHMVKYVKVREKELKLNWFDSELNTIKQEKIELYNEWKS